MQDIEQLPLEQWAEQLKQARLGANLGETSLAQTLRLSNAQLRGLESGSLSAFHGPGYYLRAVEKYARELNITLDPPVTELRLTDSQIALNRVKNQPSAAKLAKQESLTMGGHALPGAGRRSSLGIWLAALLLILIGAGTWLAIGEGWPGSDREQAALETDQELSATEQRDSGIAQADPTPSQITTARSTEPAAAIETTAIASPAPTVDLTTEAQTITPANTSASPATGTDSAKQAIPTSNRLVPSEPVPEATAPPSPPSNLIEAQFTGDCWVEIRFTDGRIEQGIYKPGQVLKITVNDIDRLTFGNAQAVTASRAGKPFDVMAFTRAGNNVARISASALAPISNGD